MRVVLDVNVVLSALLSRSGTPAVLLRMWLEGAFELVVSPTLLTELARALTYRKIRERIEPDDAAAVIDLLERSATLVHDPAEGPPIHSPDPGDDYLIGLAWSAEAILVTGDDHLLGIGSDLPIHTPASFLASLRSS